VNQIRENRRHRGVAARSVLRVFAAADLWAARLYFPMGRRRAVTRPQEVIDDRSGRPEGTARWRAGLCASGPGVAAVRSIAARLSAARPALRRDASVIHRERCGKGNRQTCGGRTDHAL